MDRRRTSRRADALDQALSRPGPEAGSSRRKAVAEQSKIENRKSKIDQRLSRSAVSAPALPSIRAVTFDVGGTLIEPWPSVGHVYAEVAARHGLKGLSAAVLNRHFAAAWRALKDFNYSRAQWAEVVRQTFRGLTDTPLSGALFEAIYSRFAQPEAWRVYDDVLPTLEAMAARGLKLGVISNWDERLRPLLRRLKLQQYFEVMVVSCEAGVAKPSPAIFSQAAKKLGVAKEVVLHVGDSPEWDLRGAQAAGLKALLLRRGANRASAGEIGSLRELCGLCVLSRPRLIRP
ncbi:MAG: HAD family hydrolase [Verrucomicrobia bacterium]|nr:MAG: HAD family hydrolase [Verrucomicrobiota bacterium]